MDWASNELTDIDFKDVRLKRRAVRLVEAFSESMSACIPQNCNGINETHAAYRFFNNPKVSGSELLRAHSQATVERLRAHEVVLAVEDTSFLSYGGKRTKCELGPHTSGQENGISLHACLAVTPEGLNLGVLRTHFWTKPRQSGEKIDHKLRPIEEKESYRWLQGIEHAEGVSGQIDTTRVVYVADRECDVYEVFKRAQELDAPWLVRAAYDRNTSEGEKLFKLAMAGNELGQVSWHMKARPGRTEREVIQTIRSCKIELKAPRRLGPGQPLVEVYAIYATEINPPEGETPVSWLLLTNIEVCNLEEAIEKVQWYRCRWQIEVFFKTLKSGCGVEKLQLQSRTGLENAISLLIIVGWRIQYLTSLARAQSLSSEPCENWLDRQEWEGIWVLQQRSKPPKNPPSINQIVKMLGKLGGHLGRKHDGFPGALPIGRGLSKLYEFIDNSELMRSLQ